MVEELLKNYGRFVSGEFLSKEIGVSRAAIKKIIASLKKNGYGIEAKTGLGYKLSKLPNYPEELAVKAFLKLKGFSDFEYRYFDIIDSTQDEAARFLARNRFKLNDGKCVIFAAGEQTKGRGRFHREWYSSQGGLWMTIIWNDFIELENLPFYSLMVPINIATFLKDAFNLDAKLKWPNDVVVRDKKIAGVLLSARIEVDVASHLVIGIGINANNRIPKKINKIAVSIKDLTGRDANLLDLMIDLLSRLFKEMEYVNPQIIVEKANNLLWKKGEFAEVSDHHGNKFKAKIKRIGKRGELICEVNGEERRFFAAEVDYP
ncbi:MAG: biotin--[acetyl-CoA-carboxylase] ligase [Actinobacteria bacterium]|nr:biotin--[acetyl-CoA-carboxylase] ligase [Actinomycetota bacterium]